MDYDTLYRQHYGLLRKFAKKTYIDGYTIDDIMQEYAMSLFECMQNYDESSGVKFVTLLHKYLTHRRISLIRAANRQKNISEVVYSDELLNAIPDDDNLERDDENADSLDKIMDWLNSQPRGDITMRIHIDGESAVDVAKSLGLSKQRVSQLDKRNIERLRNLYKGGLL